MAWWEYDELPSGEPYDWSPAVRGDNEYDSLDFHLDLGCGKLKKARLGIDHHASPEVDLVMDLENLFVYSEETGEEKYAGIAPYVWQGRMPFPDDSIESIISHHCLEHIGPGFVRLIDECYRILKPGGILRAITPLFPSRSAVEDPDHKRWIMEGTWETFCGAANTPHWHESFSVPYTNARFEKVHQDVTKRLDNPQEWWGPDDAREIRVALKKP